jgi:hypothetical protein
MRPKRPRAWISLLVLSILLIGLISYVGAILSRTQPTINVEANLIQPATRVPAEVIDTALRDAGFPGTLYASSEYDLIAEKIQDPLDAKEITVGVTSRRVDAEDMPDVVSLGTIGQQPLMVLARGDAKEWKSPADLRGRRIQIGPPGSISNEVGTMVLAEFGVTRINSTFLEDKLSEASTSLVNGTSDSMLALYSPDDTSLATIIERDDIHFVPTPATQTVAGRIGSVIAGSIPQGAVSVVENLPSEDIPAISVPITVVANSSISRAAAFEISAALDYHFSRGTVLSPPGVFPNFDQEIVADASAAEYYSSGVIPWQFRTFPAPIADLFIPIAVLGSILLIVFSVYGVLMPSVLELWQNVIRPSIKSRLTHRRAPKQE